MENILECYNQQTGLCIKGEKIIHFGNLHNCLQHLLPRHTDCVSAKGMPVSFIFSLLGTQSEDNGRTAQASLYTTPSLLMSSTVIIPGEGCHVGNT